MIDLPLASPEELAAAQLLVDHWLAQQLDENPAIAAVEPGDPEGSVARWFVRVRGEEKDVFTIWLTLGQRTLRYETYVMPAPMENEAAFYLHLLRRNHQLSGVAFEIGAEEAVFLRGQIGVRHLDEAELDRIVGSLYAYTEAFFRPALRLGFASRFA
jgi:hypothetical protein